MDTYTLKLPKEFGEYLAEMTRAHESSAEEEVRIALRESYVRFLDEKLVRARHQLRLEKTGNRVKNPYEGIELDDEIPF